MEEIGKKRKGDNVCGIQYKRWKSDSIEKNDFINYVSQPPSLQNIATVSIAIRLCTQPDIREDIEKIVKPYFWETKKESKLKFSILEDQLVRRLGEMCLPNPLYIKVSNTIRPILLQLLRFFGDPKKEYHQIFKLNKQRVSISWTMTGTIDRARFLKDFIDTNTEFIYPRELYILACNYCLVECISKLWLKLSEIQTSSFHCSYKFHLAAYWTAILTNDLPDFLSNIKPYDFNDIYDLNATINQNMVSLAVHCKNSIALKYFWYKLTEQEMKRNVKKWLIEFNENSSINRHTHLYLDYFQHTDALCFLLSYLNGPDEQREVFQSYSMEILRLLFFSWPFHKWFLPTITVMMDYLSEFLYVKIMSDIFKEIKVGRTTNLLFREVWNLSPMKLKIKLLNIFPSFWCMNRPVWKFLSVGDVETLLIMLNDASLEQKKRVMFDVTKDRKALFNILLSNKLDVLDNLLSKTLSPDDIVSFKHELESKHACFLFQCLASKGAFQAAIEFLNWVFPSQKELRHFNKTKLNPHSLYYYLIICGDYENFNLFMKWYFGTEIKINTFKQAFVWEMNSSFERELFLCKISSCGPDAWDRFEKFLSWSINNKLTHRQISQLKNLFLKGVSSIVTMGNYEFAVKLINWCIDSSEMTNQFKSNLLLSTRIINLLVSEIYNKHPVWKKMEMIMKCFVPLSTDVVSLLKSSLEETEPYKKNKLRAFYRFLDNFIEKYNKSDSLDLLQNTTNISDADKI